MADKNEPLMTERDLIVALANECVSSAMEHLLEGGCYTSSIGEPIDNEDSAIGKAAIYLRQPIPIVPGWSDRPANEEWFK